MWEVGTEIRRNLSALCGDGLTLRVRHKLNVNTYFKNISLTKGAKPAITVLTELSEMITTTVKDFRQKS